MTKPKVLPAEEFHNGILVPTYQITVQTIDEPTTRWDGWVLHHVKEFSFTVHDVRSFLDAWDYLLERNEHVAFYTVTNCGEVTGGGNYCKKWVKALPEMQQETPPEGWLP